ncbi:polysaccharide deacetylase family protein [uncultured Microbacterium sp.]|uniref:polysaccharide deacetylase family protein n=1 Tax=uncultured Microbacterium sp. TaxID=191216 RepID=UPI0028D896C5|nr:polysaccharide deacetylase family protein [uncultured Microbacterium sp.]
MASGGKRRRAGLAIGIIAAVVLAGGTAASVAWANRPAEAPTPRAGSGVLARPLTPVQRLIAETGDPLACAVTFVGEGAPVDPMLQRQDALYRGLPILERPGQVFAGWYSSAADAAAYTVANRVNGADPVVCVDQRIELYAAWKTPEENVAENAQIPILMYHQFTSDPEGESGWLRGNYAYIGDFDAQMEHIATTGFYLPTWDELSAFIDGRLFLPAHSVIITDDDADQTWFDLAVPVIDRLGLLSTSFMITSARQDPAPSEYVLRRSHTHDMHQAGENGKGRMVNWSADEIAADLNTSAEILGVREVIAYPYGHYNDTAKQGVAQAGFEMARTIEPGTVSIGTDKLALPVVRIDYGMGLDALIKRIG